jgi:hypothetical protein
MPRNSSPTKRHSTSYNPTPSPTAPVPFRNPYSTVGHPLAIPSAPSLAESIKHGVGLGAGSAIAQRMVSAVFGAPTINTVTTNTTPPSFKPQCDQELLAFATCMKTQSIETFCGQEQTAFTSCIKLSGPTPR